MFCVKISSKECGHNGVERIHWQSRTGKSHHMIDNIKQQMKEDPRHPIVLIPTQSTFQLEQAFVNDKELNGSLRTEVLHFERLSYRVFKRLED